MPLGRRYGYLCLLSVSLMLLTIVGCSTEKPAGGQTELLKEVKLSEVNALLQDNKGKVVLLNVWAFFCPPCKAEYPHLVKMYDKYAADGLVIISVDFDHPDDQSSRHNVLKFLEQQQAKFIKVAPAPGENLEAWSAEWKVASIPLNIVYDRAGQVASRIVGLDVEQLERVVQEELQKK